MTTAKDDPSSWAQWDREREAENHVKDRFKDFDDPLKFLIVTAKLLTGFDAPIEGVMYLDKPLRAHTLFQAVCRTNRRWTNPATGQEKRYGLIVDYVGLGNELAKAVAVSNTAQRKALPADVAELVDVLGEYIATAMTHFDGIDRKTSGFEQLYAAQERLSTDAARSQFAEEFLRCSGFVRVPMARYCASQVRGRLQVDGPDLSIHRSNGCSGPTSLASPWSKNCRANPRTSDGHKDRHRRTRNNRRRRRGVRGAPTIEFVATGRTGTPRSPDRRGGTRSTRSTLAGQARWIRPAPGVALALGTVGRFPAGEDRLGGGERRVPQTVAVRC